MENLQAAHGMSLPAHLQSPFDLVVSAVGSSGMDRALAAAAKSVSPVDRVYAFTRAHAEAEPILFAGWVHDTDFQDVRADYRRRYYKTDPLSRIFTSDCRSWSSALLVIDRETVPDPDYRRAAFVRGDIGQRVSVLKRLGEEWLVLNLARRTDQGEFTPEDLRNIVSFGTLVLPIAARHHQLLRLDAGGYHSRDALGDVEKRFAVRCPSLTHRERQVCARTMIGMTAEAIALDLAIGRASVLTYRQRSYRRLNISTGYQLALLVMH